MTFKRFVRILDNGLVEQFCEAAIYLCLLKGFLCIFGIQYKKGNSSKKAQKSLEPLKKAFKETHEKPYKKPYSLIKSVVD